jgi:hypothetical protein
LHQLNSFAEVNDNIIFIVNISPTTTTFETLSKRNFSTLFMEFSELSLKKCKIYPSAVKMTCDSRHTVWVETYIIQSDIKLAENGRVDRNERARMEVHSAIFGQFLAKWAFRPNVIFGEMSYSAKWGFGQIHFSA